MAKKYNGDRVSRRSALKATGGAIGLGSLTPFVSKRVSANNWIEIVKIKRGDEAVVTKKVPEGWYNREIQAREALNKLTDAFENHANVQSIGIGNGNTEVSGYRNSVLNVHQHDLTENLALPDNVDGVPVKRKKATLDSPDRCNTGTHDPVPGGVEVNLNDGSSSYATSTCRVYKGGTNYLMTTCHLFSCDPSVDIKEEKLYQSVSKNYVGKVKDYNYAQDWAVVEEDSDSDLTYGFSNQIEDQPGTVAGRVTKDGIADLKSQQTTVHKQGVKSCGEDGIIKEYGMSYSPCSDVSANEYVKTTVPSRGGDSGAAIFDQYTFDNQYYNAIVSINNYSPKDDCNCMDDHVPSKGCAAYRIFNTHDYWFDT